MNTFPLHFAEGHLFAVLGGSDFLLDTGAPVSFGCSTSISIEENEFQLADNYMGLDADQLSELVGKPTAGLIGTDILNGFDCLIDLPGNSLGLATEAIDLEGEDIALAEFMSIPVLEVEILGERRRMFFDTGAQVSYWQDDAIEQFPAAGSIRDFYPGAGEFETDTFKVASRLGDEAIELRTGRLPDLLAMTLMMADCEGIVGNELLRERRVAYLPRRQKLVLA